MLVLLCCIYSKVVLAGLYVGYSYDHIFWYFHWCSSLLKVVSKEENPGKSNINLT